MIKTPGENKMKQEFSKIYKLENQIYELQNNSSKKQKIKLS